MQTLGKVPVADVLHLISIGAHRALLEHGKNRFIVKICDSQRIKVFGHSIRCAHCERIGVEFRLERHCPKDNPHLNLYAADGMLMTKDHILPLSKGGKDHMRNYQTMCCECNQAKGANET